MTGFVDISQLQQRFVQETLHMNAGSIIHITVLGRHQHFPADLATNHPSLDNPHPCRQP
jgi:hypothetical protein